jgi:hypothetical protein
MKKYTLNEIKRIVYLKPIPISIKEKMILGSYKALSYNKKLKKKLLLENISITINNNNSSSILEEVLNETLILFDGLFKLKNVTIATLPIFKIENTVSTINRNVIVSCDKNESRLKINTDPFKKLINEIKEDRKNIFIFYTLNFNELNLNKVYIRYGKIPIFQILDDNVNKHIQLIREFRDVSNSITNIDHLNSHNIDGIVLDINYSLFEIFEKINDEIIDKITLPK